MILIPLGFHCNVSFLNQSLNAVAVGKFAGATNQSADGIAIGRFAGGTNQGTNSVAIGLNSGLTGQGQNGIAIGQGAGQTNQGSGSICIGISSGSTFSNTIVINAQSATALNADTANATYISPIRNITQTNGLGYNTTSKEITYFSSINHLN